MPIQKIIESASQDKSRFERNEIAWMHDTQQTLNITSTHDTQKKNNKALHSHQHPKQKYSQRSWPKEQTTVKITEQ